MHTNILHFPRTRHANTNSIVCKLRDNVIRLDQWRNRAKVCRTQNGVFFTTNVLGFGGDAA